MFILRFAGEKVIAIIDRVFHTVIAGVSLVQCFLFHELPLI